MESRRFNQIAHCVRSLQVIASRRSLVTLSSSALFAAFGLTDAGAKKKRKKKKDKNKRTTQPEPTPVSPPPPLDLAYECPGPTELAFSTGGGVLIAQRFVATRSGTLRQIQARITKDPGLGEFVVQLVAVTGSPNGAPADNPVAVLAAVTIPDADVPAGESTLTGIFAGPQLVQGTEYAAAISRRGAAFTPHAQTGCEGAMFSGAPYHPSPIPADLIVSVLVS